MDIARAGRSFAHTYDTGGLRRTHLKGHRNILKRLFIHAAGFNLSLVLRKLLGCGTARGLQGLAGRSARIFLRQCGRLIGELTHAMTSWKSAMWIRSVAPAAA